MGRFFASKILATYSFHLINYSKIPTMTKEFGAKIEAFSGGLGEFETISGLSGFGSFVNEIKNTMSVDFNLPDSLLERLSGDEADFSNNLAAWTGIVNQDNIKMAGLVGEILVDSGEKILKIVPGFTKPAKDLQSNCSRSSKLLTLAMATAKLEMVKEMATDVYPVLECKFNEELKLLDEIRIALTTKNIDQEGETRVSSGNLMSLITMSGRKKIGSIPAMIVVGTLLMTACAAQASLASENQEVVSRSQSSLEFSSPLIGSELPRFNDSSTVVVSASGKYALVTDGQAVTEWFDYSSLIRTSDGGAINMLLEYKGGKPIGVIGWRYEGNDPNTHNDGDRSGNFEAATKYFPIFTKDSSVTISEGRVAIVTGGKVVSKWMNINDTILTADGGEIFILQEYKGGKPIGVIGWRYEGNDPNTHNDGDRSSWFDFVN